MVHSNADKEAAAPPTRTGLSRNVVWLALVSFFTDISSEMTLTTLPLFLTDVLGVRTAIVGLIEGLAETTASLMKIFSGYISDRLGKRKWLTFAGYGLSAVSKPFLYFAASWEAVLGIRFLDRLGKGIRTAPRDALIADSADANNRGASFGLHRAGDTAGAFVGLALAAGIIYASQKFGLAMTRETYQALVLVGIIPAFVALVILGLFVKEVVVGGKKPEGVRLSLRGFSPRFKAFLVIVVLFTLGNSSDAFLLLRARNVGLSVFQISLMLVAFNLIYAVISAPAGSLSDRVGRRRLIVAGWLVYGLIYLGFALARAGWQVWALYAAYGIYYGAVEGTAKALVADIVSPEKRGTAYGVYNAAVGLSAFPASFIAGVLWQGVGPWQGFGASAPFYFGAALALTAVALLVLWLPRTRATEA
jgi:MFS family permease